MIFLRYKMEFNNKLSVFISSILELEMVEIVTQTQAEKEYKKIELIDVEFLLYF